MKLAMHQLPNRTSSRHTVFWGDSRDMRDVESESVHLVVTSPPYWQLKDYSLAGQIGYHDSYSDYINGLNLVWAECFRVLRPGCRLCINVGDQFTRAAYYGRYKVIPIRTEIIRFCETIGLDYMGAVIWQKTTTSNTTGGGSVMGSYPYPRNGILKIDYEFILLFKKAGTPPRPTLEQKKKSRMTKEEWNRYFRGHWRFPGQRSAGQLAVFPLELPRRLIKMFSFPGETILDPFLGSGTSAAAAAEQGRNSLGYDLLPSCFAKTVEKIKQAIEPGQKISEKQKPLDIDEYAGRVAIEQRNITPRRSPWRDLYNTLPYQHTENQGLERTVDPALQPYGSVMSKDPHIWDRGGQELHSVKKITESCVCILENGQRLVLAGIVFPEGGLEEARTFIEKSTSGTKTYYREEPSLTTADSVAAYLFLRNRTHINGHLIKRGLASALRSGSYRFKKRFISYEER